jgi:site-specific DNA-adenine methylase
MFAYQGSKKRELIYIVPLLPTVDIYVDVFGGGGSVFLKFCELYPTKTCVYNDFSYGLYDIFKNVSDGKGQELENKFNAMLTHTNPVELRVRRCEVIQRVKAANWRCEALDLLYLLRTATLGLWTNETLCNIRGIPKKNPLTSFNILGRPVFNKDYRQILTEYKTNENAFLYLDPPYNSKNTSCETYKVMGGDYHNYLVFIEQVFKDPATRCKLMLNIDFTGDVYQRFKDFIKITYQIRYSMNRKITDTSKPPLYHCIITNY